MKKCKKFHHVRIVCLLLCALMCVSVLISCTDREDKDPSDTSEALGTLTLPVELASGGVAGFTIVTSQNAPETLTEMAVDLFTTLNSGTGARFTMSDDYVRESDGISEKKEILIGLTSREESIEVMNEIGYFDSAVRLRGNKIVVAAHTKQGMSKAMEELKASLITLDRASGSAILTRELTFTSDTKALLNESNNLGTYKIVYPESSSAFKSQAQALASTFKKSFGTSPEVIGDSTAQSECEILLGGARASALPELYGNAAATGMYEGIIKVVGKRIIVNGGEYFPELVCSYFAEQYVSTGFSDRFNIPADLNCKFALDSEAALSVGASIRVMTYNVLSKELSPDKPAFGERRALVSATMLNYLPDVIGVQEVDEGAYEMLAADLGDTYAFGATEVSEGKSYTSLMYNKKTVRLIESGNTQYSVGQKRLRLVSWGYFEHLETGKKFTVASMHWNVTSTQGEREVHAKESTAVINGLREKYNCPIITTGDFNCSESTTYYRDYLKNTNQSEAAFSAEKTSCSEKNVIDHITYTSDVKALFFKLLKTPLTKEASDHNPSYADFRFN